MKLFKTGDKYYDCMDLAMLKGTVEIIDVVTDLWVEVETRGEDVFIVAGDDTEVQVCFDVNNKSHGHADSHDETWMYEHGVITINDVELSKTLFSDALKTEVESTVETVIFKLNGGL